MKRMARWAAAAALACSAAAVRAEPAAEARPEIRIGVINVGSVVKQYQKTKLADAQMEKQAAEFKAERERMLEERERLVAAFEKAQEEAEDKALSDEARERKRSLAEEKLVEVKEYEARIRDTSAQRRKQLEEQRSLMYKGILEDVQRVVRQQAAARGLTLVLDSSDILGAGLGAVIYRDERMDMSESVLGILNKETAGAAAPAPAP